jgi:hypothetical protein
MEEDACGYSSGKTVRSIDSYDPDFAQPCNVKADFGEAI